MNSAARRKRREMGDEKKTGGKTRRARSVCVDRESERPALYLLISPCFVFVCFLSACWCHCAFIYPPLLSISIEAIAAAAAWAWRVAPRGCSYISTRQRASNCEREVLRGLACLSDYSTRRKRRHKKERGDRERRGVRRGAPPGPTGPP